MKPPWGFPRRVVHLLTIENPHGGWGFPDVATLTVHPLCVIKNFLNLRRHLWMTSEAVSII
jgi:hypothetical protein